jgi:DNA polymerase-3 subunit gamma/tau
MSPEPRLGFEMTLLRMLAFRPDPALETAAVSARSATASPPRASVAERPVAPARVMTPAAPAATTAPRVTTAPAKPAPAAPTVSAAPATATAAPAVQAAPSAPVTAPPVDSIDSGNWPAVVDAAQLTGMARQFALNCVPASFVNGALVLRLDAAAADRRTKQVDDKLVQALSKYFGREIRVIVETAEAELATPARQRALAEQDRTNTAVASFELDPAVRGLRERFGAEIDGSSVKPGP